MKIWLIATAAAIVVYLAADLALYELLGGRNRALGVQTFLPFVLGMTAMWVVVLLLRPKKPTSRE